MTLFADVTRTSNRKRLHGLLDVHLDGILFVQEQVVRVLGGAMNIAIKLSFSSSILYGLYEFGLTQFLEMEIETLLEPMERSLFSRSIYLHQCVDYSIFGRESVRLTIYFLFSLGGQTVPHRVATRHKKLNLSP